MKCISSDNCYVFSMNSPFYNYEMYYSTGITIDLKCILSDIDKVIPAFLCLPSAWCIFFPSADFHPTWVFVYKVCLFQATYNWYCFCFISSDNLYFIRVVWLLQLNVIIDVTEFRCTVLLFALCLLLYFWFLYSPILPFFGLFDSF